MALLKPLKSLAAGRSARNRTAGRPGAEVLAVRASLGPRWSCMGRKATFQHRLIWLLCPLQGRAARTHIAERTPKSLSSWLPLANRKASAESGPSEGA